MRLALPLILLCSFCYSQQNLKQNYTPIKSSGALPPVFTQNVRVVIKKEQDEQKDSNGSDRALKNSYITSTHYQIERIIRSGNVLLNDEITQYVNKVADEVLKHDPKLRKQLSIYTLKSPVVNAYSFDKGYIFIDMGLIAQLESEAQLAYILCHEISHYTLNHQIKVYSRETTVDKNNYDGKSYDDRLIEKCQYSKETESEADTEGLKMFERTNYSLNDVNKVFDVLQYSNLPFELVEFKKSFFESPGYVIPKSYMLKDLSPISDNSNADDSKQTHPNTAKRKQNISALIAGKSNAGKQNAIYSKEKFEYVRDLARFEMCRLYLKQRDYGNALYAAYILKQKYPENQYASEIVCKSIYAIALYRNDSIKFTRHSYMQEGIPIPSVMESYPQQMYNLIYSMPKNEWVIMSLNYVYREYKKYPDNVAIGNCAGKLFKLLERSDWGISDFRRLSPDREKASRAKEDSAGQPLSKTELIARSQRITSDHKYEDSIYYKDVYVDLFEKDEAFRNGFPARSKFNDSEIKKKKDEKFKRNWFQNNVGVNKVLLLEPFYYKMNLGNDEQFLFLSSDKKQEDFINTVNLCASLQKFELITIDPGLMSSKDVDKINDYSVINDWLEEKLDSEQAWISILNTNDVDKLIEKYGTQYVLKTGLVSVKNFAKRNTYFYASLFDLKNNKIVYGKYERFSRKDHRDLVNAKTYEMINELKNSATTTAKKTK